MKIHCEFSNKNTIKITVNNISTTYYLLTWKDSVYSLWYSEDDGYTEDFVWERRHRSIGEALGSVVASLTDSVKYK